MSELPQADELPRAAEGYDPARVEEAFASFADRVRELEAVAAELRGELRALRAERAPVVDDEDWPANAGTAGTPGMPSPDWVAAVPPPFARDRALPRLVLEGAFLLLVALLAGLAELSTAWIVVVMAVAWALVVLGEWAAAAKRARWRLDEIPPALEAAPADRTGPWDLPVVEATVVEATPDPEGRTVVTKLPVEADAGETGELPIEPDADEQPPRRRRFWRRRVAEPPAAEPAAADPWES
jgi:hypothetical protein